jgi:hypothetical protein
MRTKTIHWAAIKSVFVAIALVSVAGFAQAAPKVLPPHSNAYGMGYEQLAGNWLEWVTSIPNASSPLLDPDGSYAAIGQGGKVWFLAGNMGGSDTRSVTVPAGKAVFLPVLNYFWVNTPELGDNPWSPDQEAYARSILAGYIDTAQELVLQIDGKTVPNVYELLRASSTVGVCNLPTENLWGANAGPHPCVADGFWALLPPMSTGQHVIHFSGELGAAPGWFLDVTYHLTVGPRSR